MFMSNMIYWLFLIGKKKSFYSIILQNGKKIHKTVFLENIARNLFICNRIINGTPLKGVRSFRGQLFAGFFCE